ncbi:unnamed protein product [Lymnaea stagnalis]|uniref:Neuroguidin n=1 Tax=Lymnaea stagnalis TaxID=6523 RepID=A0AAV2H988_LYMST
MKDLNNSDIPESLSVLREIKKASGECLQHVRSLISKVKNTPQKLRSQGISFLDVKNQLMVSYMANLGLLMDKKTSGESVKDDPSIDRLVEIRTVLEKMRPIEHKLKYQINKVVTAYKECKIDPSDPRKFKANFAAFTNMPQDTPSDQEETVEQDSAGNKSKVYVAPKLAPVHYSDDETAEERQNKQTEKKRKRAISSAMLREMREQYTDAPIEIIESHDIHRITENRKMKEKTEYEENNFVRLTVSKKDMAGSRKMGTMSALGALADFDDFDGEGERKKGGPAMKKRKVTHKKQKGKRFNKKGGKKRRK